jgi:Tfp pilus assembly protein PilF
MSLLLDALKRAEDAKRAKADAASGVTSTPADAVSIGERETDAFSEKRDKIPAPEEHANPNYYPTLSLEIIDERPADPVADSSLNPAAPSHFSANTPSSLPGSLPGVGRATTSIKSLALTDEHVSPKTSSQQHSISNDELALAALLQSDMSADGANTVTPNTSPATAAFRSARSPAKAQDKTKTPSSNLATSAPPRDELSSADNAAQNETLDSAANATQQAHRDAVKNAFAVKSSNRESRKIKWLLPIVSVLVLFVGAGSWYVWQEISKTGRKPPFAGNAQKPSANTPPANNAQAPSVANAPARTAEAAKKADLISDATTIAAIELPPLLPPPAIAIAVPKLQSAVIPEVSVSPREAFAKRIEALALPPPNTPVKLKPAAQSEVLRINPSLSSGYAALSRGDYELAKQNYAEAISSQPTNVDANLGFATAAARSGDIPLAERFYRRVLELDPRNATAASALLTLAENSNATSSPTNLESELKLLIDQDPNAAASHFALGNVYASERRWQEAQQSYFEAARLAPQNPDYLYNLAVSLDQLAQPKQAAQFYQRAMAAPGKTQFDRSAVEKRLAIISASK